MRQAWALCALIFFTCIYAYGKLFTIEYLDRMDSIEAAYIGLARYAAHNFPDFTWFPLWYNGIPYQNTYPPLLHWIVALWSRIAAVSPGLAFHQVVALFFCLCPVAIFWLARRLSGSDLCAFAAGMAAALLSPSDWLIPNVYHDVGGLWYPRRFMTLVVYGEGTHQAGMTFLISAILALDWAATKRTAWRMFVAALLCGATVLSNWIAALCLVLFVAAWALATPMRFWPRVAGACIGAALMIAPWIVPSTLKVIQFNSQTIGGDFSGVYGRALPKLLWIAVALLLAWIGARLDWPRHARFALVATWFTAGITLSAEWFNVALFPQPHRYHVEMELAMALGFGSLLVLAVKRLPVIAGWVLLGALMLGAVILTRVAKRYTAREARPVQIESTVEYEVAQVLDRKMPGCRVFLMGTVGYWVNAFSDQPNVLGGFDQGVTNFMIRVAHYAVGSDDGAQGREREISIIWLKALGANAVHVGGPKSREHYKPWKNPQKFDGALEKLWQSGDDVLYRVPQKSCSLGRVVPKAALPSRTPVNGLDIEPLLPYVAAIDDVRIPDAPTRWTSRHSFELDVPKLDDGQVVSLQIAAVRGWHADRGTLSEDAFGQMVLSPGCSNCTVRLFYDGGTERRVAVWLSLGTLGTFLACIAFTRFRATR